MFDKLYEHGMPRDDKIETLKSNTKGCFECAIVGDSHELHGSKMGNVSIYYFNFVL